jgi:hypothetical protein
MAPLQGLCLQRYTTNVKAAKNNLTSRYLYQTPCMSQVCENEIPSHGIVDDKLFPHTMKFLGEYCAVRKLREVLLVLSQDQEISSL